MGYALKIYETFRDLGEEKASVLADFVEYMESRKAATSEELKESELRLQLQIEETRKELQTQIEGTRKELQLQIEEIRKDMKEMELKLIKEISETKASLVKWMFLFWIGQVTAVAGILAWLLR